MSVPTLLHTDSPRTRATDPLESHLAADSNTNRLDVQAFVLNLLSRYPMTDDELTTAYFLAAGHPDADDESPRKRRSDLKRDLLVVATGAKRPGRTGRNVNVWQVSA